VKFPRRQFLHLAAGAVARPFAPRLALAQVYPSRPITVIVPFAPGGATDVIARSLAERMRIAVNQTVVIENVTGAGGTIGVGRVARATPDGYTLSIGQNGSHTLPMGPLTRSNSTCSNQSPYFQPLQICCR
jgi:tripartite-type tricarboxylate transporter receptor subunit TctC